METDHTLVLDCPIFPWFCQAPAVGTNKSRAKKERPNKYDNRRTDSLLTLDVFQPRRVVLYVLMCLIGLGNPSEFPKQGSHYAGSNNTPSANHADSDKAVSQYDVACFQHA